MSSPEDNPPPSFDNSPILHRSLGISDIRNEEIHGRAILALLNSKNVSELLLTFRDMEGLTDTERVLIVFAAGCNYYRMFSSHLERLIQDPAGGGIPGYR